MAAALAMLMAGPAGAAPVTLSPVSQPPEFERQGFVWQAFVWQAFVWQNQQQLVTVVSANWEASSGTLHRFERRDGHWLMIGEAAEVSLGRNGSAWGLGLHPPQTSAQALDPQKHEGDGRAPAGVFAIGPAFGYADAVSTALNYLPMQAGHVCVDVPASPLYNQIVDSVEVGEAAVKGNTEPMRRDLHLQGDDLYRLGFVIAHNPQAESNAGSCIFAHLWRAPGSPTAGCTAMDAASMRSLIDWLDVKRQPRFLLLPTAAYAELQAAWDLPRLR